MFVFRCIFLFPQFIYSSHIIAGICGVIAITCSLLSSFWCRSIAFQSSSSDFPDVSYGIWRQRQVDVVYVTNKDGTTIEENASCEKYSDQVEMDSMWKASRAFSIVAPVLGLFLIVSTLFVKNSSHWLVIAIVMMVFITLFQGLTMLIFQSNACDEIPLLYELESNPIRYAFVAIIYDGTCKLDSGSIANIVAIVFWFITGLTMLVLGPPGN